MFTNIIIQQTTWWLKRFSNIYFRPCKNVFSLEGILAFLKLHKLFSLDYQWYVIVGCGPWIDYFITYELKYPQTAIICLFISCFVQRWGRKVCRLSFTYKKTSLACNSSIDIWFMARLLLRDLSRRETDTTRYLHMQLWISRYKELNGMLRFKSSCWKLNSYMQV